MAGAAILFIIRLAGARGSPFPAVAAATGLASDLIPAVYEGGLTTWECTFDLIAHMAGLPAAAWAGKRVLEVSEGGVPATTRGGH